MHPSVGLTLPRTLPFGRCQIAGHWFPGGLQGSVNAAVVHLDETILREDAKEFTRVAGSATVVPGGLA
jgi:hypothetical protein